MKNKRSLTVIIILLTAMIFSGGCLYAEISLNGSIETENGLLLKTSQLQNQQNTLGIKLEYGTDKYHLYANPELKVSSVSLISDLNGLKSIDSIAPYTLNLKEAYIDIYEFLIPVLDVRLGKQIIVWGTADRINPTSSFCPADLSDLFDWGEKLGVVSLLMNFYIGDIIITGAYTPVFTPTLLPQNFEQMAGTSLGTTALELPGQVLGETQQVALRINFPISTFDIYASYYYGRYSIPVTTSITLNPDQSVNSSNLRYPRLHVAGLSFSGSIFEMGVWAEAGVFIPEAYSIKTYMLTPSPTLIDETDSELYIRYVLGTDYTFKNGIYVNFQFAHGFDHEIGKDQTNDYFITRLEKSFFDDKLKIIPLTLIFSVSEWSDIPNNYGLAWVPEIQFFPSDSLELALGCYLLHGSGSNLFNNLKDNDSLFFKAKVSF